MRVEPRDIGHNKKVIATRNEWDGNEYRAEGLIWYNQYDSNWYFISNNYEWDGNRSKGIPYDDYRYSWILISRDDYDTLSPILSMEIKKKIIKHKMMTMT